MIYQSESESRAQLNNFIHHSSFTMLPIRAVRASSALRSKWRKVITGDEKKRIRDHLIESQEVPEYIKLIDKVTFTCGVLNICACEYFLTTLPEWFWIWYSMVVPILLCTRLYHFRTLHWEYFLLDFCYFAIGCTILNLFLFPHVTWFSNVCFIFANGPLPMAIVVWRNSLVFHDYDKITSVYIHILPSMLSYAARWHGHFSCWTGFNFFVGGSSTCTKFESYFSGPTLSIIDFTRAAILYVLWQVCYFVKTEVIDREKLELNPQKLTSLRWMSKDTKNPLARAILRFLKKVGIFVPGEDYDSKSLKTKIVFMGSQFLFTLFTFIPTGLCYYSKACHIAYIIFVFTVSVFYGASFYIEVFSSRYQKQLEMKKGMRKRTASSSRLAALVLPEQVGAVPSHSASQRSSTDVRSMRGSPSPSRAALSPSVISEMDGVLAGLRKESQTIPEEQGQSIEAAAAAGTATAVGLGTRSATGTRLPDTVMRRCVSHTFTDSTDKDENDGENEDESEDEDLDTAWDGSDTSGDGILNLSLDN